jgi:very-short-patch-repair endonuclease
VPSLAHERDGVRVVSVAEALVHAWEEDPDGRARDALFAALRDGLVAVAQIREALNYYPHVRGRPRLLAFLAHLRDGMHSYLEYLGARKVLNTPDLRGLGYQQKFVIEGNVFYADRYDPATRTVVEFDGQRWHGTPEARERDTWRDALFRSIGHEVVRLPYLDVAHRAATCRARGRAVIAARAGPP